MSTPSSAATTRCANCWTSPTAAGCGSCSMGSSTTPAAGSGSSITSWRTGRHRPIAIGSTSTWTSEGRREFLPYPPREAGPGTLFGYAAWWNLPALPKLNTDNPEVREYLLSVAEHWLRFGIDGWRLDVPAEIDDPAFWSAFRQRCRAIRDDAYLVGEVWVTAPEWVAGDRFDALMDYPLAEAILGYVGGRSLDMASVASHI